MTTDADDVIVIGGGPAGLSAALSLVRARRRVVVVDAGRPRNGVAPHMHGVLGHDGLPPRRLLELGRAEVLGYGGRIVEDEVVDVRIVGDLVEIRGGKETLRGRRLLVATGLTDILPDIPGLSERWGTDVVVCPYCDGWEHRDSTIGVIATSPGGVDQALLVRQWSDRIVYFENGVGSPSEAQAARLAARGIRIERGVVGGLVSPHGGVSVQVDERTVDVDVVFTAPTPVPNDQVLRALGASTSEGPFGSWVDTDADGRTSVPGVWAVGNVVDVRANVSVSLGAGALIAGAINADLTNENTIRAVA